MSAPLDWDGLRYLLAVQRAGSLAAGARALRVDKATVSRRVASLEEALGIRIFDRRPAGWAPTPSGARVLQAAGEIDATIGSLAGDLLPAHGDARGSVLLTAPQWFVCEAILPALRGFRAAYPAVELVFNAGSEVLNIAQRQAEVALRNVKPSQRSVTTRRVGRLASALYASHDYLRVRGTLAGAADGPRHDLVAYDRAISFLPEFSWLDGCGARVALRGNDALVLAAAASAGLGMAVLPCFVGDARAELARIPAGGFAVEEIWIVAPGELQKSGRVRAVIELLVQLFREHSARLEGK